MRFRGRYSNDFFEAISSHALWTFLAWQDIKIRYRRSKIGPLWITISTAIFCVSLGVVYGKLFKIQISELLPFLTVGLIFWNFLSSCIGESPSIFVENVSYMKDMRINPFTILLRAFARNIIILAHNCLIVLGTFLYFSIWPGWIVLLVIPGFLLMLLNLLALAVILSILGARFRDLAPIVQNVLQVMFMVTPIFWFPRLLPDGSWVIAANPIAYFIDLIRSPLLGYLPQASSWWTVTSLLFLTSIVAARIYSAKKSRIVFWI